MDYEKKYNNALERAREINNEHKAQPFDIMLKVFPELAESKDEEIRKDIISALKYANHKGVYDKHLAWLEKQESVEEIVERCKNSWYNEGKIQGQIEGLTNEEKYQQGWHDALENQGVYEPTNKVEPKFKVGDWVTNGHATCQITFIDSRYWYSETCVLGNVIDIDKAFHLWTIKDAKDGDVLFHSDSASNGIFIFKELLEYEFGEKVICYCDYDSEDHFCLGEHHTCCWADAKILHPATKEQRDLLFNKMHKAGYVWDAEKKELKKIEQNNAWSEEDESILQGIWDEILANKHDAKEYEWKTYDKFIDWLNSLKDRIQPQPRQEWSEDDKKMFVNIKACLRNANKDYSKEVDWLKSLKPYLKNKWIEEDEERIKNILSVLDVQVCWDGATGKKENPYQKEINWLKSLKERYTWKPSDEQIELLEALVEDNNQRYFYTTLNSLYEQLKKLREG